MNQDGIDLLKEFEGWRPTAYTPVPGDRLTIGYGFTDGVKEGDKMTRQQGEARLKREVVKYEEAVLKACDVTPNENQLAAMTCFAYNIGIGAFKGSGVLKAHNRGDEQSASRAFGLWNKSGGKVYAGLTRRRAAEAALYLKPEPEKQADHPMPQTVDAEDSLAKSPIMAGGVTTVGASAVGGISTLADLTTQAGTVADNVNKVHGIQQWLPWILLAICILGLIAGGVIVWKRYVQRKHGWS